MFLKETFKIIGQRKGIHRAIRLYESIKIIGL